jgi:NAD(P)-dependent dehydrogenase (short-subunit alcohol dehydrogenase family)
METPKYKNALIVGAGEGLSASLARLFNREGLRVALAARSVEKLGALCSETGAQAYACNASDPDEVERLFGLVEREIGTPDVVVYNASARARGPFIDLVPAEVAQSMAVSAFGGFLVAQQAAKRMLPQRHGAILFTGASASVKGYAQSAPFAMGKFALRGLAQSMARELSPQGLHVAHFVIDGDPLMPTNTVVHAAIDKLATDLGNAGATITRKSPLWPDFAATSRLFMRMLLSFVSVGLAPEAHTDAIAAAANLPATDISLQAERLRGIALSHRDWLLADGARARLRAQWRTLFESFDAVICPIMPTPAVPHDHSSTPDQRGITIDGKDYPSTDQLAWQGIANLTGLPATAVPIGRSPEGLPIGVQIVGPWLEDRTPLKLAELIEREFGGFVPPPAFDD